MAIDSVTNAALNDYTKVYKMRHLDWSGGQRTDVRPTLLNNNESQILKDVTLDQRGTLYPCAGHKARYASPVAGKVDGVGYFTTALKQYLVLAVGDKLYYDDLSVNPPVLVQIAGTFSPSTVWSFTTFNSKLYITNGIDKMKTWDGTNLVTLDSLVDPIAQTETVTVTGSAITAGNVKVTVTAAGLTGSPIALDIPVVLGTVQVETVTVAGSVTTSGNSSVIVTANKVSKTISVAVSSGQSASTVAGLIRTALTNDVDVSGLFTVSGSGVSVVLTAKSKLDNDDSLNIAIDNGTCAGLTPAPTSVNTTVGVSVDDSKHTAAKIVTALKANTAINDFFYISNTDAAIAVSPKTAKANDDTMSIVVENGTCTGFTKAESTTTTEGKDGISYTFSHTEVHNNMLWGVEPAQSRLRWSKILDGNKWDALNFIDFNSMDGDGISRAIRFQSYIFVAKYRSKAYLTGDRTSNYAYTWLEGTGSVGQNAVCVVDKYVVYVATDGVHMTDLITDTLISTNMDEDWRKRVNKAALSGIVVTHWRNYIVMALPVDGSSTNNEVWYYDMRCHAWVVLSHLSLTGFVKVIQNGDDVLYGSDANAGQIIRLFNYDYAYYQDGVNAVEYTWLSKEWTFNEPERNKLFRNIYLEMEGIEDLSRINMWIYVDDVEYEVNSEAIDVPDGAGLYRHVRLIPPVYGVVLGRKLSIKLQGRVGVRSVVVEYSLRSPVAPGGVV